MKLTEIEAVIEALLFISGEAVPLSVIAQTVELDKAKSIIFSYNPSFFLLD